MNATCDGTVEDAGEVGRPGRTKVCSPHVESRPQAEIRALPLRGAQRHRVQQPRRTGPELAELVEHERDEAPFSL